MESKTLSTRVCDLIWNCVDKRWRELGYKNRAAYLYGLVVYDLLCFREHKVTARMLSLPEAKLDAALDVIGGMYMRGERAHAASHLKALTREILAEEAAAAAGTDDDKMFNRVMKKVKKPKP